MIRLELSCLILFAVACGDSASQTTSTTDSGGTSTNTTGGSSTDTPTTTAGTTTTTTTTTTETGGVTSTGPTTDTTGVGTESTGSTGSTGGMCQPGEQQACYSGPPGTLGVGDCVGGTSTCDGGVWGPCEGEVSPAPESCEDPGDEDCDGFDPCAGDGAYEWHKVFGADGWEVGVRLGFDGTGALVLAAVGTSSADFGGGPLPSSGSEDLYLAKFAPDGAHVWSKRFGDAESQFYEGAALAVGPGGDIVVGGNFDGTVDFGGVPFVAQSNSDAFLAKFTPDGGHVWSKAFKSTGFATPQALALDGDGAVLFAGQFTSTIDLGGGLMMAPFNSRDVFFGKFTAAGAHAWSLRLGDNSDQFAYGLAVDASGNSYVGGSFFGTIDAGNGPLVSAGDMDVYLIKYDPLGNAVWSKHFGNFLQQELRGLTIDANGRISLAGFFEGSIDLGGGPLVGISKRGFAAQFDAAGAHLWSRTLGDGFVYPAGIAADGFGTLLIAGSFTGGNDFGGGQLTSAGGHDIFALKLAPGGGHVWSKRFGDSMDQAGVGVAASSTGMMAVCGSFAGGVNFGGGPATSKGDLDGFVAVFGP